jgi:hypothetical protein
MQWEYKLKHIFVSDSLIEGAESELNEWGEEGWEAVSAWGDESLGSFVILKRPK